MRGRFNGRVVGQDYTGRNTRHNGRAGMYNAVQSALAPSLDITLANGLGPLFTYTRATTATVKEGVDSLIKSCLSGELRVQGARRVGNAVSNSEALGSWTKANSATVTSGITDPNGGTTAFQLDLPTGNNTIGSASGVYTPNSGVRIKKPGSLRASIYVKADSAGTISLGDPTYGTFEVASLPVTTSWTRICTNVLPNTAGELPSLWVFRRASDLAKIYVWHPQVEDVTGQSNQNPSEYVSVGVLSSPFHGYFADGVKYFSYQNGNTVASNVVTEAQGAAITGTIGYLAEGARTNLCLQSETLDNASWTTQASLTLTANATTAPSGATTADQITANTTTGSNVAQFQTITLSAGTTYAISMFWKAGTQGSRVKFGIFDVTGSTGRTAVFNMSTGAYIGSDAIIGLGLTLVGTPSAESIGNGWFRGQLAVTTSANTSYNFVIYVPNADTGTNQTSGDNYYAWGTQIELGTFASSYIPTTTAAVARNADVLTCPFAGIGNDVQGAAYIEAITSSTTGNGTSSIPLAFSSNSSLLYLNSGDARTVINSYDGTTVVTKTGLTDISTAIRKRAVSWGNGGMSITGDGAACATSVFDGSLGSTSITIGAATGGTSQWFGVIKAVRIYRNRLRDAQLQAMTS